MDPKNQTTVQTASRPKPVGLVMLAKTNGARCDDCDCHCNEHCDCYCPK